MKLFNLILTTLAFIFSLNQSIFSQDMIQNFNYGERFILHSRLNANGDFWQLTADDENGNWMWDKGISFFRSSGYVGIGTNNTLEKLTLNGNFVLHSPSDNSKRLTLGTHIGPNFTYGYIAPWNTGGGNPHYLIIGGEKVGIETGSNTAPVERLDINGRLRLSLGVIQNGTSPITTTSDLGLYSQLSGWNMRFVTNQAPIRFFTDANINPIGNTARMTILDNGNVLIGTEYSGDADNPKLLVNGIIKSERIKVTNVADWPDYVFKKGYDLMSLLELEGYINKNGHLPEIPTEAEVNENGIELGNITSKLLHKVEELTLYVIEQQKMIKSLQVENEAIKVKLNEK